MSLNWNISNVKDWESKKQEHDQLLTDLIWSSLSIGMGKITEGNVDEWVYRINRISLENGGIESFRVTEEDVSIFIGLTTNVGTLTATEFESRIKRLHPERFKRTRKELDK